MMRSGRRLAEYILARIASGAYPVGMRIPSIRRLAARFDMPYSTVQVQLTELVAAGILHSQHGRGMFVARSGVFPSRNRPKKLAAFINPGVIHGHPPDEAISERERQHRFETISAGVQTSIAYSAMLEFQSRAMAAGYDVEVRPLRQDEMTVERFMAGTADCCGAAFFCEYDVSLFAFEPGIPVVATLMAHSYGGQVSLVNVDEYLVAELAAAYFRNAGIGRVEIIGNRPPVYRRRAEAFYQLWTQAGFEAELSYTARIEREMDPATGYFFSSDTQLFRYYRQYEIRYNRQIDRDFVILGVDGKRRLNPDWPRFPTVDVDWREIGGCMFDELRRRLDDPRAVGRRVAVGGRLMLVSGDEEHELPEEVASVRQDRYEGRDYYYFRPDMGSVVEK